MSEHEILALDLDWDLVNHLGIPESIDRIRAENVDASLIEDEDCLRIFNWAQEHFKSSGSWPTPEVLEHEFDDIELDAPLAEIDDLIGRLRTRYMQAEGMKRLEDLVELYHDEPLKLGPTMFEQGRELLAKTAKRGEAFAVHEHDRYIAKYDEQALQGRGVTFGFPELDDHFYGQRGLTFMLGAPKSMKTWFTVNAVIQAVLDGKCAVVQELEIPAAEMDARIRHMAADVPWWKYLKGGLSPADRKALAEASEVLTESGTYHVLHPEPGERDANQLLEQATNLGADCIYIDQLQYVEVNGKRIGTQNETGLYFDACATLRDYSDKLPIWVVHQFNRSVMNAEELPSMQQIKGSAAIEETATLALGLWANKDMRKSSPPLVACGTLASRNYEWLEWEFAARWGDRCVIDCLGLSE